jgi:hypothetical protein
MQFSQSSLQFIPRRFKYSSQYPVLKHIVYVTPLMSETMFHIHIELQ